jgi:hypothetical protein
MKYFSIIFTLYIIFLVFSACNIKQESVYNEFEQKDTIETKPTIQAIIDSSNILKSIDSTSDSIQNKKHTNNKKAASSTDKKTIEMPKPGVSDRDKHIIDSIKSARLKIKE